MMQPTHVAHYHGATLDEHNGWQILCTYILERWCKVRAEFVITNVRHPFEQKNRALK